jgi:curved DNA-binding protein CbpA
MEYLNSLKNLYSLNDIQLGTLKNTLKVNIFPNNIEVVKQSLNKLMKQQTSINGKIPQHKFNKINNFIVELYSYVNTFQQNSGNSGNNINKVFDQSNYHLDSSVFKMNRPSNLDRLEQSIRIDPPKKETNIYRDKQNMSNIDPYELYGFSKSEMIDIDRLKSKYKKYALQTHPDKNNGDSTNFKIITNAFKLLYEDYKLKINDKQFNELKNNSREYLDVQRKTNKSNINFSKDNFNVSQFNTIYDDNRISDINDDGYGDWSKSTKFDSDDIIKDNKINNGNFNTIFENNVTVSNNVVTYKNPRELFMNHENNCEELGKDKVDNYTGKTSSIDYTDYKEAHTTSRLIDTNIKLKNYNSVNQLKLERTNISELTPDEVAEIELEKLRLEEYELKRQQNVSKNDNEHFKNYNKIHSIMLSRR